MQVAHTTGAFDQLGLDPVLVRAVYGLGYEAPTPIQKEAIPPILAGRDARPSPRSYVPPQRRLPRAPGPCPRRGGSDARHGFPPGCPEDRRRPPTGATDPPLLRDDGSGDRDALADDHAQSRPHLRVPA